MTELMYPTSLYRRELALRNARLGVNEQPDPRAVPAPPAPRELSPVQRRTEFLAKQREEAKQPARQPASSPAYQFLLDAMAPPPPSKELSPTDRRAQYLARNREEQARQRKV